MSARYSVRAPVLGGTEPAALLGAGAPEPAAVMTPGTGVAPMTGAAAMGGAHAVGRVMGGPPVTLRSSEALADCDQMLAPAVFGDDIDRSGPGSQDLDAGASGGAAAARLAPAGRGASALTSAAWGGVPTPGGAAPWEPTGRAGVGVGGDGDLAAELAQDLHRDLDLVVLGGSAALEQAAKAGGFDVTVPSAVSGAFTDAARGVVVNQATLSRDVHALGLLKGKDGYEVPTQTSGPVADASLARYSAVHAWFASAEAAGSLVVVKTPPGGANPLAIAIDRAGWAEVAVAMAALDAVPVGPLKEAMEGLAFVRRTPLLLGAIHNCFGDVSGIYRKSVFASVGGFHERHGVTFEDWHLHLRVAAGLTRLEQGTRDLTIISNNAGTFRTGIAALLAEGRVPQATRPRHG